MARVSRPARFGGRGAMRVFCVMPLRRGSPARCDRFPRISLDPPPSLVVMPSLDELPRVEQIEPRTLTEVLIADYRFDQARLRAAVDAVFDAYPALGTVFELRSDAWFSRPGGAWSWGVEPA